MIRGLQAAAVTAALAVSVAGPAPGASAEMLRFQDLYGWESDNHQAALEVFVETCADMDQPEWQPLCALAEIQPNARTFFELFFRPVLIGGEAPALFTGYYEPELDGSRTRDERYRYPLYRKPPEVQAGQIWYSRQEIEDGRLLAGRGLEIAWLADPVDLFFLQIQGSGRIRFGDGSSLRVGYGGTNGHQYRSIGTELIDRGIYQPHQVSAQVIRNWTRRNPEEGRALLQHNPAYVFFREIRGVPADRGPLGAMNRSITALRTVAVDPEFTPLGAPVWIEKSGRAPLRRLMVAQDTGSAIKGPQRADIFYGTGEKAGRSAGRVRDPGKLVVLLPIERAFALVPGG